MDIEKADALRAQERLLMGFAEMAESQPGPQIEVPRGLYLDLIEYQLEDIRSAAKFFESNQAHD